MAAALIGEAIVSAVIDVLIKKMASPEVVNFFKRKKLNERLLKKLKETMRSVHKVLNDAEVKQITDPYVKAWLDDLRVAVYEADDFLDGIAYESLRLEIEGRPQTHKGKAKVRNLLSSLNPHRKGMGEKEAELEKILQNLERLIQQKDTLGLIEGIGEKSWSPKIPTTSLPVDPVVYGRDQDKEVIVNLLLSDAANGNNPSVIPIVGMGGVGKTTLAQSVYNDSRVQRRFDLKAWVCISEEFDILKVTKDILKEVGAVNCDTMTPNQLHLELKQRLTGKIFLVVLDDVWNDDRDAWGFLFAPLKSGSMQESKIIVTTRSEGVASAVSSVSPHHLRELSVDDCWFVFARHAFHDGSSTANEDLEEIGRKIVRKCKGLPLAAKTLGGLLRSNIDAEEWEKVLKSNMWDLPDDKILPALRLSYHYLPSHLKQCFAYCALFPKDYGFRKEELILLWMAEDFLIQHKGKEIDGNKCFDDLVSRSFFQQSSVNPSCFVMHDLISDLAMSVSGEFCFRMEDENSSKPSEKARYLSYAKANSDEFDRLYGAKCLRSFLVIGWPRWLESIDGIIGWPRQLESIDGNRNLVSLQSFERLRVLSLPLYLPDSIGNLKHLRYLNLRQMIIDRLPDSVSSLYNLQTLILLECMYLRELPTNMMKLINLCHLDITGTNLLLMPPQMSKLMKLQNLSDFFVGNQRGSSIAELEKLQDLGGKLRIWNLWCVVNVQDVEKANLKSKKHLKELVLSWDCYNDGPSDELKQLDGCTNISQHEMSVLEQLQPHTDVKRVSIHSYRGTRFPHWVGHASFSKIVSLVLSSCKSCCSLPPLGQLASLKELSIKRFDAVETVGAEFCGSFTSLKKPFGSLEILSFDMMPKWHEWICDTGVGAAFPSLRELYISDCPNLTKVLTNNGAFPLLRKLHITNCGSLKKILSTEPPSLTTLRIQNRDPSLVSLPMVPTIHDFKLVDISRLIFLRELPSGLLRLTVDKSCYLDSPLEMIEQMGVLSTTVLEEIYIGWCEMESLYVHEGSLEDFTSLRDLTIEDCPNLVSFPQGRIFAPNLISLRLVACKNLKSLPDCMYSLLPSLGKLYVRNCPELESIPEGRFPSKLVSLKIYKCNKLSANFGMQWDLQSLPSLTKFGIDVESFPEKTLLPSTLTSLEIWNVQNVRCLDYEQLQHLSSLTKLSIVDWPHLQSITIPEEGLPSTLTHLNLYDLQNLISLGIQHLTSLEELSIWDCSKLEMIPEGLPSSLSRLNIIECPLLAERCKREEGEDWPKISHIPKIKFWE